MFKLMGKEINAILGARTILIWTYDQVMMTLQFLIDVANDAESKQNQKLCHYC